jgi:hypothetical protein
MDMKKQSKYRLRKPRRLSQTHLNAAIYGNPPFFPTIRPSADEPKVFEKEGSCLVSHSFLNTAAPRRARAYRRHFIERNYITSRGGLQARNYEE